MVEKRLSLAIRAISRWTSLRPWGARIASDHVIDISKSLTGRYDASARRFAAGRSSGFRAIAATRTTARSKAGELYAGSTADLFGCAPVRQFDGATRSIPTAAQSGFGVHFGRPATLRLS